MKNYILLPLGLFFLVFVFYVCLINFPSNQAGVYFFDVGQGDSALIRTEVGQNILIDGGPDEKVIQGLAKVLPFYERTIDLIILTHPHDDHVNGLNAVLDRYQVEQVLYTGVLHSSPIFLSWLDRLRVGKTSVKVIDRFQILDLSSDEKLEFLYPLDSLSGKSVENLNNSSVVVRYVNKNIVFLFMGDIEKEIESKLLGSNLSLQANVLKLGHHGSDTSSSVEFLQAVNPQYAIVSAGEDNPFGHPSLRVLQILKRMGVEVFETSKRGMVSFFCDEDRLYLQ